MAAENLKGATDAAVLLVLAGSGDSERILLTQRASHLSLHAGEVAFPGGMREPADVDLEHTAVRETQEEVGLNPDFLDIVGRLATSHTGRGIRVTPFVAKVKESVEDLGLCANQDELDSFFWVPTRFLLEDQRERTDVFDFPMGVHWAPVYNYLGYTIWGFTARVLVEFVNRYWGAEIGQEHRAPSRIYTPT